MRFSRMPMMLCAMVCCARLGDTTDAQGNGGFNAAAIGFRYDFSWKTPHTQ